MRHNLVDCAFKIHKGFEIEADANNPPMRRPIQNYNSVKIYSRQLGILRVVAPMKSLLRAATG